MDWLRTRRIGAKTKQRNVKENGEVVLKELVECCDGKCNPIKNFSSDQIIKATDNFCNSKRASRIDVYYRCYKGMLDDRPVLIKKGKYELDMEEICRDIAISSMVSGHKNFLKLLGCCLEFSPPVLVFEYAEIITLGPLLASNPRNLRRIKIAREVSNALTYLHTAFSRAFIHSNLDPFTIYVDGNGIAKLGNFCNCISIPEGETFVHDDALQKYNEYRRNTLKGTHVLGVCYLPVIDPEYKSTGKVTTKTDMHSFGAFMLALLQIKEVDDEVSLSPGLLKALADLFIKPYDDARFPLHHHVSRVLRKFGYAEVTNSDVSDVATSPVKGFLRLALRCIGCNLGDPLTSMIEVAKELRVIENSYLSCDHKVIKLRLRFNIELVVWWVEPGPCSSATHGRLVKAQVASYLDGELYVEDDVKGVIGFVDPDYYWTMKVTEKVDIYSFGVVMLVLLSGRAAVFDGPEETPMSLNDHVSEVMEKGGFDEIVDKEMWNGLDGRGSDLVLRRLQVEAFLKLALRCVRYKRVDPVSSMIEVAKELRLIEKLS